RREVSRGAGRFPGLPVRAGLQLAVQLPTPEVQTGTVTGGQHGESSGDQQRNKHNAHGESPFFLS
ncbi:MAG: hypothetical protein ACI9JD_005745, partial [Rhodococcus sp. (in: high G+C Gram-positive bacteria)]